MVKLTPLLPLLGLSDPQQRLFHEAKANYTRCIGVEASALIDFTINSLGEVSVVPKADVQGLPLTVAEGQNVDIFTQCLGSVHGVLFTLIHRRESQNLNGESVIKYFDAPGGSQVW